MEGGDPPVGPAGGAVQQAVVLVRDAVAAADGVGAVRTGGAAEAGGQAGHQPAGL